MVGITRDVTTLYLNLRRDHKSKKSRFGKTRLDLTAKDAGERPLLDSVNIDNATIAVEMMPKLPPAWLDVVEEAQEDISKIKEKLSLLQKAQQRRLLIVFEDSSSSQPDSEIQILCQNITTLFKQSESRVVSLTSFDRLSTADKSVETVLKNAQRTIATQLQALSQAYRKQQKHYINEMKKREQGENLLDFQVNDEENLSHDPNDVSVLERDILTRNDELTKIAEAVTDLHAVFQDLAVLVIDQGTVLDCIDYNMEQVVHNTERAKKQLIKAEHFHKSSFLFKAAICLTIVFIILVVAVVIKRA
ncbi:SnaRE domain-containing protein [Cardiosporidium cionae]|uniref:SnaRE domain-containing protein n=1 Tax=Cardiosporidium cionae TaxID=476202 RepID=A0ABQ7JCX9_9APIC|nr:SnaRE domain-containing protein [Cardiosporidium cionae]|eukprot:KAF8821836.1 SnaRE domain-containing protein [Cardiosporidium cionae]